MKRSQKLRILVPIVTLSLFILLIINYSPLNDRKYFDVIKLYTPLISSNCGIDGSRICFLVEQRRGNSTSESIEFHTSDELLLTKRFTINKRNYCGDDGGRRTRLLTIVFSTVTKFFQRKAIRQTWAKQLKKKGVRVMFLIAKSFEDTLQKKILEEDLMFNDLIQSPFIDDYYNETLKAIAMLNSLNENCRHVHFVLKTDEDVLINVNNVFKLMDTYNDSRKTIFGQVFQNAGVYRETDNKWYVPSYIYKPNNYPDYPNGPIYMFTGDSVPPLLANSYNSSPFYIDDAYVMGIVAEKSGIRRMNVKAIGAVSSNIRESGFNENLGIHPCNCNQMAKFWSILNSSAK